MYSDIFLKINKECCIIISFEVLEAILSGNDENNKFISKEEAMENFNKIIKENNKRYEK